MLNYLFYTFCISKQTLQNSPHLFEAIKFAGKKWHYKTSCWKGKGRLFLHNLLKRKAKLKRDTNRKRKKRREGGGEREREREKFWHFPPCLWVIDESQTSYATKESWQNQSPVGCFGLFVFYIRKHGIFANRWNPRPMLRRWAS